MEMADLCSYETMELLTSRLVAAIMKRQPPGYMQVSVAQALDADQVAWQLVESETRGSIRRAGRGDRPLEAAFKEIMKHEDFKLALQPLQGSRQRADDNTGGGGIQLKPPDGPSKSALKKLKQKERKQAASASGYAPPPKLPKLAPPTQTPFAPNAIGKSAAKGKGKGPTMPSRLIGMCPRSSAATGAKRICFAYNLDGCSAAQPGGECPRGWHLCMVPIGNLKEACSKFHTVAAHT